MLPRPTRPVVYGERGVVATPHYLASTAALDVLREGGTAVDAAIAADAVLSVVLPHMTGLGGDAFWLAYDARGDALLALDGSGVCGRKVSAEDYASRNGIPPRGPLAAITVPGAVDSWRLAHEKCGRLPLARLLAPAIEHARRGGPVSGDLHHWVGVSAAELGADPGCKSLFLAGGAPPPAGTALPQPALARTLELIARGGCRAFYEQTGKSIARYLASRGGRLGADDFGGYSARWVKPLGTRYRGFDVWQVPPPSQGLAGLLILNFLEHVRPERLREDPGEYYHAVIQGIKWALQKRDACLADPEFSDIPLDRLLDPDLAARECAAWLADARVGREAMPMGSDTTFVAIADGEGNAVGVVQSLYFDFGAAVLDPESGVLLQNRGSGFSLRPEHPNFIRPGKRPASTLMSGMLFKEGKPYLVYGTQGGDAQPQTQTSIVTRVLDFGMDVQMAIEAPRVLHGRSWGDESNRLLLESFAGEAVFSALRARGHPVEKVDWPFPRMGTAQAVRMKGPGRPFMEGGADPRGEGLALGY